MAADVMALSAKKDLDWVGFFHLKKAFQELFCIPGSPMTRSNDFSDRSSYIIQCAIPKAIAKIKDTDGRAPMPVKRFLLDVMRYNDNRGNDYSDDHYLATLMLCLAQSLTKTKRNAADHDPTLSLEEENEQHDFEKKAMEELGRHQRLDEWIPTYHNIYTTTALDCGLLLMRNKVFGLKASDFMQYTRVGNADNVRLRAWECMVHVGMIRKGSVVKCLIQNIATDPSPYFRAALIRILDTALGQIAIGDEFKPDKVAVSGPSGLVIEQEEALPDRAAEVARKKLDGALRALKADFSSNEAVKNALEKALYSTTTSARDVVELLEICSIFYIPVGKLEIRLKLPRYWGVQHLGDARLRFYQTGKVRDKMREKPRGRKPSIPKVTTQAQPQPQPQSQPQPQIPATPQEDKAKPTTVKIKLKQSKPTQPQKPAEPTSSIEVLNTSFPPPPPVPTAAPEPPPPAPKTIKLSTKQKSKSASPAPSSAPAPSPAAKPAPIAPPPTLAAVASASPPVPVPTPAPAQTKPPKIRISNKAQEKEKKLKIIVLKLAPEKLKGVGIPKAQEKQQKLSIGVKRKAANAPDGEARALKRQASGATEPGSLVVKLRIGRANAEKFA